MTGLFWNKILFMTEILVAEALFTFKMKKRKLFALRAVGATVICLAAAALFPLFAHVSYTSWYASLMFLLLFLLTVLALEFLYDIPWNTVFFCAVSAYTAQHLSYEIFALFTSFWNGLGASELYGNAIIDFGNADTGTIISVLLYAAVYFLVYALGTLFFNKKLNGKGEIKGTSLLWLSALILVVDIVLNAVVVYVEDNNVIYDVVVSLYNILCCLLVFYIQWSMVARKQMSNEITGMQAVLAQAQKQYKMQKENIRLINTKVHDLKYQIGRFERGQLDTETIEELKNSISIYDATVKTGNEVLDIILTEKSLFCNANGIKLTCMADCSDLNFIREGDLYSLFGNIVDNAIEAVSKLTEPEKRYIGLNIHTIGKIVTIKIDNFFVGSIEYDSDGLPVTAKSDKNYHGFGMKSVSDIVERYNGTLSVVTDNDIFRLNIMFPIAK